jgi:Na+-driven multidrug efflux pump
MALLAEIVLWLTITHARTWVTMTASWITVVCCLLCVVLFMAGFFRWHAKGLWLALPMAVALALPVYAVVTVSMEMSACRQRPDHTMCMP